MSADQNKVSRLMTRYYPGPYRDQMDEAFCDLAHAGMKVLDAGCGGVRGLTRRAPLEEMFIVGIDRDPIVHTNPFCNATVVCDISQ